MPVTVLIIILFKPFHSFSTDAMVCFRAVFAFFHSPLKTASLSPIAANESIVLLVIWYWQESMLDLLVKMVCVLIVVVDDARAEACPRQFEFKSATPLDVKIGLPPPFPLTPGVIMGPPSHSLTPGLITVPGCSICCLDR